MLACTLSLSAIMNTIKVEFLYNLGVALLLAYFITGIRNDTGWFVNL